MGDMSLVFHQGIVAKKQLFIQISRNNLAIDCKFTKRCEKWAGYSKVLFSKISLPETGYDVGLCANQSRPARIIPSKASALREPGASNPMQNVRKKALGWLAVMFVAVLALSGASRADAQSVDGW